MEYPIEVSFRGHVVGKYRADLFVDDAVIVETKAGSDIAMRHVSQLMNYLKATDIEVGLVLNFGENPKFERRIFTNDKKAQRGTR